MARQRYSCHKQQAAEMRDRSEHERVRASRAVSANKIARAPREDGGQAETGGHG